MTGEKPLQRARIVVIGAGPGGYAAALKAADLGADVTLIERELVGGTCLNRGCIPTKALLSSTEALRKARLGAEYGFSVGQDVVPDFVRMQARKEQIVTQLRDGVTLLLRKRKVKTLAGVGRMAGSGKVEVESSGGVVSLEADRVILASGSEPALPQFFDFSHPSVVTSTGLLNLTRIPSSLLIVGGGAIGCEFLSIFVELGSKVTLVEMMPQIVPTEDARLAKQLLGVFRKSGAEVLVKTKVERVAAYSEGSVTVELTGGELVTCEKLLVSIGRSPNTPDLRLETAGVEVDGRGFIKVDENLRTTATGVYAIGDVTGGMLLAHVATHDGIMAAENCLGDTRVRDLHLVPRCIYTSPEVAAVGLSEDQAREEGREPITGTFRMGALGKALAMGESQGFIQVVADQRTDEILGASMMGPHVTDVVHEVVAAMRAGLKTRELADMIHAHPTISEALMEAAADVHGESIHVAR